MDQIILGHFITATFLPFVAFIAGGVISITLLILILVMFRGFLPEVKFK